MGEPGRVESGAQPPPSSSGQACGHGAYVIPSAWKYIDMARSDLMKPFLRHCVLPKGHDGEHDYGLD